ncbi:MAG: hypothetical protein ACI8QZ_001483 [Chlamydiales bacterium]|jgi:hypothetical protein
MTGKIAALSVWASACLLALPCAAAPAPAAWQATGSSSTDSATWPHVLEDLRLYGDLRLRQESSFDLGSNPDRHRQVMRLRLGANYRIDQRTEVGARMVTGDPTDPNSTHVTLGDGFEGFGLSLDRAYLTYRPETWTDSEVRGGKFSHPFYRNEVYGELLWDADVQPEGVLARKSFKDLTLVDSVDATLGVYALQEQRAANDAALIAAEVTSSARLSSDWRSRFALAYYGYTSVEPGGSTELLDENRGNATVDDDMDGSPDRFVSDYGILDLNAGFTFEGLSSPLILSTEFLHNARADERGDGFAAGVSYGSHAVPGDWLLYYQYQRIEQDSVFSAFAQDDFLLATNHQSHLLGVNYQLSDGVGLVLWGLVSDPLESNPGDPTSPWRIRFDLNVKF